MSMSHSTVIGGVTYEFQTEWQLRDFLEGEGRNWPINRPPINRPPIPFYETEAPLLMHAMDVEWRHG